MTDAGVRAALRWGVSLILLLAAQLGLPGAAEVGLASWLMLYAAAALSIAVVLQPSAFELRWRPAGTARVRALLACARGYVLVLVVMGMHHAVDGGLPESGMGLVARLTWVDIDVVRNAMVLVPAVILVLAPMSWTSVIGDAPRPVYATEGDLGTNTRQPGTHARPTAAKERGDGHLHRARPTHASDLPAADAVAAPKPKKSKPKALERADRISGLHMPYAIGFATVAICAGITLGWLLPGPAHHCRAHLKNPGAATALADFHRPGKPTAEEAILPPHAKGQPAPDLHPTAFAPAAHGPAGRTSLREPRSALGSRGPP
jgi:hypothetical protein